MDKPELAGKNVPDTETMEISRRTSKSDCKLMCKPVKASVSTDGGDISEGVYGLQRNGFGRLYSLAQSV